MMYVIEYSLFHINLLEILLSPACNTYPIIVHVFTLEVFIDTDQTSPWVYPEECGTLVITNQIICEVLEYSLKIKYGQSYQKFNLNT